MAKSHARSSYAKVVGEITMGWNQIEREMNSVAFHYMKEDSTVAGFILNALGNQTKADFITLLVNRFEQNEEMKQHVVRLVALFNRLRENRNIVEHAVPHLTAGQRYIGVVYKLDKNSDLRAFDAPISLLVEVQEAMDKTRGYSRAVRMTLHMIKNGRVSPSHT